ncbi:MAG: hypothetical protein V1891_00105 [bacterium]
MFLRKHKLLNSIIDEFISSAEPVGSGLLVDKYKLKVSPATVRNEMMELEKEGYIFQPHTSAGRIPTEKGYKFYIENSLKNNRLSIKAKNKIKDVLEIENYDDKIKNVAKQIAYESQELMIIAFKATDIYYTGISNLFSQPEFYEHRLVCNLSEVIDKMEEVIYKWYNSFKNSDETISILIGENNPFDRSCSSIIAKMKNKDKDILMCMLGPMRMDYGKNIGLVEYAIEILENSKSIDIAFKNGA